MTKLHFTVLFVVGFVGCSSPPETDGPTTVADTGADSTDADGQPDDSSGQDMGPADTAVPLDGDAPDVSTDLSPGACGAPPTIEMGGTPESDALAESPERCGQPAHTWVDDPSLGEVVALDDARVVAPGVLEGFAGQYNALDLPGDPEHSVKVQPFEYVTQDRGELTTATALLALPSDVEPGTELDVILYLHGSSGASDACALSDDPAGQFFPALLASYGYMVVAPDYLGMRSFGEPSESLHPYLIGQPTAIASLDSVRAASRLAADGRAGACTSSRVALWGASQGGHATLWVDRLAPYYAREFTIVGGVASVPAIAVLDHFAPGVTAFSSLTSLAAVILAAAADWYDADLSTALVPPHDEGVPAAARTECIYSEMGELKWDVLGDATTLDEVVQPDIQQAGAEGRLADVDPWGCFLSESDLTRTSIEPIEPAARGAMLVIAGTDDQLVDAELVRAGFESLCSEGAQLEYMECSGRNHFATAVSSFDTVIEYIEARLAGDPPGETCVITPPQDCG